MLGSKNVCGPTRDANFGKTLVLNRKKWNGILGHLERDEKLNIDEEEKRFQNYLKTESRNMTKQWENSVENIRVKKNEVRKAKEMEKIAEGNSIEFFRKKKCFS